MSEYDVLSCFSHEPLQIPARIRAEHSLYLLSHYNAIYKTTYICSYSWMWRSLTKTIANWKQWSILNMITQQLALLNVKRRPPVRRNRIRRSDLIWFFSNFYVLRCEGHSSFILIAVLFSWQKGRRICPDCFGKPQMPFLVPLSPNSDTELVLGTCHYEC